MTLPAHQTAPEGFDVVIVAQRGRLSYEALLFAASLRHSSPRFAGRLLVAEPEPGPLWEKDPRISDPDVRSALADLGAEIVPFETQHFGDTYPTGNKIEMLAALPEQRPFVFFDSDTLITGDLMEVPFDFNRPSASLRREGTWPRPELYGPGYASIWKALYDRFGLDFASSLDPTQPDEYWERYLYFNAGVFYHACPRRFGDRFLAYAREIRDAPPPELCAQPLLPWLDQIALPLVIHSLGGGRDALQPGYIDAEISCHYRAMPLLYAREPDRTVDLLETIAAPNRLKKVLKRHEPFRRFIYQGRGRKVRALFNRTDLPRREQAIRNRIRSAGLWIR
ncbi:hypothetical protein R5H30_03175 [Sulfitobacter sp. D35]|uniref:hypothetical protein n=1 Tax=Sulfitobacter sp. D35 TaxID=3083252 RepID=UPI00296F1525|nr:hypothetical protein [Sulfitobacter sp. D35]MDW4496971.1 hypothetical protein [Sulfitobacter sp. D35]